MRYETLLALKDTVANYEPLRTYVVSMLGKEAKHFIGNKLRQRPKADEFPFFAYVPRDERIERDVNTTYRSRSRIYVVYGVHDSDAERATQAVLDISELLKECLRENYTLGGKVSFAAPVLFETDEGYYQPFFYARMLVEVEQ